MAPTPGGSHLLLSVGVIDAQISLHNVASDKEDNVSFCNVAPDNLPAKQPSIDSAGNIVDSKDLRKGYKMSDGSIVIVEKDEIAALMPEKTSVIKVKDIVDITEVNPLRFNTTYHVGLDAKADDENHAAERYRVISKMIGDRIAIGELVLRSKHMEVAIWNVPGGGLMLSTLRSMMAVNSAPYVPAAEGDLIDAIASTDSAELVAMWAPNVGDAYDPTEFKNEFRDAVLQLIASKTGNAPASAVKKSRAATKNDDLLAMLKANSPKVAKKVKPKPIAKEA